MLAVLAVALAAGVTPLNDPAAQRGPWLELSAGPSFVHRAGNAGLSSGPLLRAGIGMAVNERFGAELWLSGTLEEAPLRSPGDVAIVGGGLGGRARLTQLDRAARLFLWGHAGLGYQGVAAGDGAHGLTGYAGTQLVWQPWVRRFALGASVDALAGPRALGFAVLPFLRAAF